MAVVTNLEFSRTDEVFKKACQKVDLGNHIPHIHRRKGDIKGSAFTSLARQASKWRMGKGKAYKEGREI